MQPSLPRERRLRPVRLTLSVLLPTLALVGVASTRASTLVDFGYGSMRMEGQLPSGSRPLLVIIANYQGTPALAPYDWGDLVFGSIGQTLVNYYREVSNNRFTWSNAGILWADFSPAERMTLNRHEQIVQSALAQNAGYNVLNFDANGDGTVTGSELSILIIQNLTDSGGQTLSVRLGSLSVQVSIVAHRESLMTFCHEICHTLDGLDLYGNRANLNTGVTLMGATIASDSNRNAFHLDPWHKLALGWSEPRIVPLRGDGSAVIPAAQLKRPDAPVLLFDPLRGSQEYYLLEYRTRQSPSAGSGFDGSVASEGLLVWHVWQDTNHLPVLTSVHTTLPYPVQGGWTACSNCLGSFYRPNQGLSHCPARATHQPFDSHDFSMVWNSPGDPGQPNWRWCSKCQSLFYGGNNLPTRCPADGGAHDGSTSANYTVRLQSQQPNQGQRGWAWCGKCQSLFAPNVVNGVLQVTAGVCPAGGPHNSTGSGEYSLHYQIYGVFCEAATNNQLGGNTAWSLGNTTPYSRWFSDGTDVRVRFRPRAVLKGGDEMEVEWISELPPAAFSGETWVDFRSPGLFANGSFENPFNRLRDAVDQSPYYRRILLKGGNSAETITLRKSVQIEAPFGPVTIGR